MAWRGSDVVAGSGSDVAEGGSDVAWRGSDVVAGSVSDVAESGIEVAGCGSEVARPVWNRFSYSTTPTGRSCQRARFR